MPRATKIVATLGPASNSPEILEQMIRAAAAQAGAARMVQMDVRGDHPVHGVRRETQCRQGSQQSRHREVGAGVDEGGAAAFNHQVGGVEHGAVEAGVDGVHAVAEILDEVGQGHAPDSRDEGASVRATCVAGLIDPRRRP